MLVFVYKRFGARRERGGGTTGKWLGRGGYIKMIKEIYKIVMISE